MVLFLDLSSPDPSPHLPNPAPPSSSSSSSSSSPPTLLSALLTCYPIISTLTHSLDLNTLHALSLTSPCIRAAILPYRAQLVRHTLRCVHDGPARDEGGGEKEGGEGRGKVWPCARDLVGECRRCGVVVCRNCTFKPPSASNLPMRLRRLCPPCASAPLAALTPPPHPSPPIFCTCAAAVYLCQTCAVSLAWRDGEYQNTRKALARFAAQKSGTWGLDMTGTHVGWEYEAIMLWPEESVRCWRAARCIAVKEVEVEVEVEAEAHGGGNASHSAGYGWQEVEGVGGVMKWKRKVKVGIGSWVAGWGARGDGSAERRRAAQDPDEARNWCGWCERVALGRRDEMMMEGG